MQKMARVFFSVVALAMAAPSLTFAADADADKVAPAEVAAPQSLTPLTHGNKAAIAASADTLTIVMGLAQGAVELKPLGAVGATLLKPALLYYVSQQPEPDRAELYAATSSMWGGAAASNACMLLGGGPLCLVIGAVAGSVNWRLSADERQFWAVCKDEQTRNATLTCTWNPEAA